MLSIETERLTLRDFRPNDLDFLRDLKRPGIPEVLAQQVMVLAVRLVVDNGLPYHTASWQLWRDHHMFVPFATIQSWMEAGGKRAE